VNEPTNELTAVEREALAKTYDQPCPRSSAVRRRALHRLLEPIDAVTGHWHAVNVARARNSVLSRVHTEQQPYWCWDESTWIDVVEHAAASTDSGRRGPVVAIANLLGGHRTLHHHVQVHEPSVAGLVFGREVVRAAISEVVDTLRSWDASRHTVVNQIPSALSDLLLVAGTPRLEEVTEQQVRALAERYSKGARRSGLIKISRVLAHRGIIAHPLHNTDPQRGPRPDTLATVPASWLAWAQRWRALSTLEPGTLRQMFSVILIAGRWAAERHPEALEPHLWTRDIAAEYVADTLHAVHGQ
jgi:hypothetical protein